jgi:DNA-binding transcriptional MerR regulator
MPTVQPVDLVALSAVILGCLSFLIPIAGLTARFAIKPIAEALSHARDSSSDRESVQLLERRLALLEQEVHGVQELRAELARVMEDLEFQKQLARPKS